MEKLDLTQILKGCSEGMKLYSPTFGEVTFVGIGHNKTYPIETRDCDKDPTSFTRGGKYYDRKDAECVLFPSKDNRDWSTFKVEQPKVEQPKFEPFQKVLVRNHKSEMWRAQIYSLYHESEHEGFYPHFCVSGYNYKYCIPYKGNEHLNGTTNEPKDW